MAAEMGPVPVFMRVGGSAERQVGAFTPDVVPTIDSDQALIVFRPALAALLREVADAIEAGA